MEVIPFAFFGIGVILTLVSAFPAGQVNLLWTVALILLGPGNPVTLVVHCVLSPSTTAQMLAAFASALL